MTMRRIWQDNLAFWMNATFLEVLQEVLSGLLIMEPNVEGRDEIRGRRPRTLKRILSWSGFTHFGCYSAVYSKIGMKGKDICMKNAWICDVQNLNASWVEPNPNLRAHNQQKSIIHLKYMKHCYNAMRMQCMSI